MSKDAKPLPVLTDEQKAFIEANWFMDVRELAQKVFKNPNLTLRHVETKAVRAYLASIGKVAIEADDKINALVADLTTEQQEFIRATYKDAAGPVETARALFKNERLLPSAYEVTLVRAYIRKIDPRHRREDEMVDDIDYQPPGTLNKLVARLNRYQIKDNGRDFEADSLNGSQKNQLEALLDYLRTPTFKVEADKFQRRIDREVFEYTFLAMCWDKPDLSAEHLLQFIQLASLTAQRNELDRDSRKLNERFSVSLDDPSQRLQKAEVDALNAMREKTAETIKQITALIKTLSGERSKQINEKLAGASSMHPLVQAWKQEETRKRLIAAVDKLKRQPLKAEVERFSTMDSIKAEVWGLNANDIIN